MNRATAAWHLERAVRLALAAGLTLAEVRAIMVDMVEDETTDEECVFCGERRSPDSFEDGLRCRICAEEQDEEQDERATSSVAPAPRPSPAG